MKFFWLIILALLLVGFGLTGFLYAFWNPKFDSPPLLTFGVFACYSISAIILGNALFRTFLMPRGIPTPFLHQGWSEVVKVIGMRRSGKLYTLYGTLCVLLLLSFGLLSFVYVKLRERYEFENSGMEQTVTIAEIRKSIKGLDLAVIHYQLDGKMYSKELLLGARKEGDTASIVYSTNTPYMVKWRE